MQGQIRWYIVGSAVGLRGETFKMLCFLTRYKASRYIVTRFRSLRWQWATFKW